MEKCDNLIRKNNLDTLRNALSSVKSATKPEIAKLTGLSVVTINALVASLQDKGEINELRLNRTGQGRPAMLYSYNVQFRLALLICLYEKQGRNTCLITVHDLLGKQLMQKEQILCEVLPTSFDEIIERALEQYPSIGVIAFGLPAAEFDGSMVITHLQELKDTAFRTRIEQRFSLPVVIENDVIAAVYGYSILNDMQNKIVAGIYMPMNNPPGGGVCIYSTPLRGKSGMAGEIQYLPLGIDWERFVYTDVSIRAFLVKAVKTMMSMYNPHVVVIYSERTHVDFKTALFESCRKSIERVMLPEIVTKFTLQEDFEAGIKDLALKRLRQEL